MTRSEFIEGVKYTPRQGETFDFEQVRTEFEHSAMSVDEYCKNWTESYEFFGFATGIENDCTQEPEEVGEFDWMEDILNTPDRILADLGLPDSATIWRNRHGA